MAVLAFHELAANAAQQEPSQRHAGHFALDYKGKMRRKGGVHEGAVQIAGVVCYHDAGAGGEVVQALHLHTHAGACKKDPGEETGAVSAPVQAG